MFWNKNWGKQSLRLLKHEFKRGELTIICFAIMLAVATVFSLTGFTHHIKQALYDNSTRFIAADKVWQSARPLADELVAESQNFDVNTARLVQLSSMVFHHDKMQLSSLKAVSSAYPLRGELRVITSKNSDEEHIVNAPEHGQVWADKRLIRLLELDIGDSIEIGLKAFTVAGFTTNVPDASFSVFTSGPVIILNEEDLAATELIQPGSRLTYKYLFSGEQAQIQALSAWVTPQVNESQRWYDISSRESPLTKALKRADKYLSLASMLSIVLAAVAVAVASRRYSQRHQPAVAVFKALGASRRYIIKMYLLHWGLLSVLSIFAGLFIGFGLLQLGLFAASYYVAEISIGASTFYVMAYPMLVAIITGFVCAIFFAIRPLLELVNTSPMRVVRGNSANILSVSRLYQLLPLMALLGLLWLFSGNLVLSLSLLLGAVAVSAVLLLLGRLLMNAGRSVGSHAGKSWHLATANLKRRASENSVQLVSFTVAIKLLLLILVLKNTLINEWQEQLPDNTANRFLININEAQVSSVDDFIKHHELSASGLYPIVLGRLTEVNHQKTAKKVSKESDKASDNGRKGVGRELRLTWREAVPDHNEIIAGQWWSADDNLAQVSVEKGVAERLAIDLGDALTFTLGSKKIDVVVSSIRDVDWQSLQPNFFMIFNPPVLKSFPSTYIASLYLPEQKTSELQTFLAQHPTISIINVDVLIKQLQEVIEQVSVAIEFVLFLVVIAGGLVLVAQVQASMEERERELAILRTLGAPGKLLRNSVLYEFFALGAIAGLMASAAMELSLFILQSYFFELSPSFHWPYWIYGIVSGALFVGGMGWLTCRKLLMLSSVTLIRRTL